MTREFRKFLYRLDRKDYKEALATISNGTTNLGRMARDSVRLEPDRRKRSRGKVHSILRDLSASVYRALCSSMLCNDPHHVSLASTAGTIEVGYEDKNDDEKVLRDAQFTIAVSFEAADEPATVRKRFWDEMNIKTAKPPSPVPPRASSPPLPASKKPKKTKGVSFSRIQPSVIKTFSSIGSPKPGVRVALTNITRNVTDIAFIETMTTTTHEIVDPDRETDPLVDLCMALQRARKAHTRCYGYLVDKERTDRQFRVYPTGTAANSDTWSIVTLHNVLEQKGGIQPLTSLRDRVRLGLAIASSVLQLSKTPWLPDAPTSKNVHFFKRGHSFSYHDPFLLRTLPEQQQQQEQQPPPRLRHESSGIGAGRHATLFGLGIMLLEIILGSTFERLRAPHEEPVSGDSDDARVIRDSVTVFRLLKQVAQISESYRLVVLRCIECTGDQDLDDERFREDVCSRVVMELETILDHTELGRFGMAERRWLLLNHTAPGAGEQGEDSSDDEYVDCEES